MVTARRQDKKAGNNDSPQTTTKPHKIAIDAGKITEKSANNPRKARRKASRKPNKQAML